MWKLSASEILRNQDRMRVVFQVDQQKWDNLVSMLQDSP